MTKDSKRQCTYCKVELDPKQQSSDSTSCSLHSINYVYHVPQPILDRIDALAARIFELEHEVEELARYSYRCIADKDDY